MAHLNGKLADFTGRSMQQIGELLLEASPNKDGRQIRLELTPEEEDGFESVFGLSIGRALRELVQDAAKAKGLEVQLAFVYCSMVFTTS